MIKLEKKSFLLLCVFLFSTMSLCSQSKEQIMVVSKTLEKKEKNCIFKIQYPIIKLGKNSPLNPENIKAIGKILIDDFTSLDKFYNEFECNTKDKNNPAYSLNGVFEVKLLNDSILSIYSSFSGFTEGNTYPNNTYYGYNFDLSTGKTISFESLFKKDSKFLIPLHKVAADILVKDKIISGKDEFISAKKNKYDFYLSPDGIHLINIFDMHAMQTVEVKIPFNKIDKYLDKENTLKFLK